MTDQKPVVAKAGAYGIEMEPGTYFWCACGRSNNQPFCDGSHTGTSFSPTKVVVEEKRKVGWCGCKHSKKGHICDGTHKTLPTDGPA